MPTEHQEQKAVIAWRDVMVRRYPRLALLFHVPNAGRRSPWARGRMLADGLAAGVPDLLLPVPSRGCHGCAIEMKRRRGSVLEPAQRWWLQQLEQQGWSTLVARGADAAIEHLTWYLHITSP